MNKHTCTSCGQQIPAGQAVIRTVMFQRVAWHRTCLNAPATQDHEWTGKAA